MIMDGLVELDVARPDQLTWTWADMHHSSKRSVGHLYQYGLSPNYVWESTYPVVQPLCGAPRYQRASHEIWSLGVASSNYMTYEFGTDLCTACILALWHAQPDIFDRQI